MVLAQERITRSAIAVRCISRPFHLSICVGDLNETRKFYGEVLGLVERRGSKTSAHFNFYGCQVTFHHVPGYSANAMRREVDAEDVPVPHFGAALTFEQFDKLAIRLQQQECEFFLNPHKRFIGKAHEQYVMFLEDPSGYGIEIKSFTKAPVNDWA